MSHHSDDAFLAGSDSFWEPGNYKRTTRRIENGNKLCSELMEMVSDRAEIEKNYAKAIKAWAVRWNNLIEKGNEYGTTEAAWKACLVEADRRCDLHNRIKEDLNIKVNQQLRQWQKDNYHKSMMSLKEKKDMDDQFKKAQKNWAKLLQKVNKSKQDYHNACKVERTAVNHERNATGDSALSQDQIRKLQDKVQKSKDQVQKTRDYYEVCLQDINNYNAKYMEDMTEVFERCQRMEAQRLQCFKDILFTVQKCLNLAEDPVLPQIYEEFYHTVNNADHEKDLRWWSNTHGVNMPMNWPQFEEYAEEFREIAGKGSRKTTQLADGNITLINQRHVGDDLPEYNAVSKQNGGGGGRNGHAKVGASLQQQSSGASSSSGQAASQAVQQQQQQQQQQQPTLSKTANNGQNNYRGELSNGGGSKDTNPFDEPEWDEDHDGDGMDADADGDGDGGGGVALDPLVDNGEPGVKVRALYDYEAAEEDELEFKTGDIFEKLEDEDEQGWCKGRKDGRVGLYPANYIEVIK